MRMKNFYAREGNKCYIDACEVKTLKDDILTFTKFKLSELMGKHIKHEEADQLSK